MIWGIGKMGKVSVSKSIRIFFCVYSVPRLRFTKFTPKLVKLPETKIVYFGIVNHSW